MQNCFFGSWNEAAVEPIPSALSSNTTVFRVSFLISRQGSPAEGVKKRLWHRRAKSSFISYLEVAAERSFSLNHF